MKTPAAPITLSPLQKRLIADLNSPFKMNLFFLKNLPSLLWWGVAVKSVNALEAQVNIPFSWRTQNPFKSTYFAALSGAAELSTGLLADLHRQGRGKVSMLITATEGKFLKKATDIVTFTCKDGLQLLEAVEKTIELNQPQSVKVTSTGTMANAEIVAVMHFTWSFKSKN